MPLHVAVATEEIAEIIDAQVRRVATAARDTLPLLSVGADSEHRAGAFVKHRRAVFGDVLPIPHPATVPRDQIEVTVVTAENGVGGVIPSGVKRRTDPPAVHQAVPRTVPLEDLQPITTDGVDRIVVNEKPLRTARTEAPPRRPSTHRRRHHRRDPRDDGPDGRRRQGHARRHRRPSQCCRQKGWRRQFDRYEIQLAARSPRPGKREPGREPQAKVRAKLYSAWLSKKGYPATELSTHPPLSPRCPCPPPRRSRAVLERFSSTTPKVSGRHPLSARTRQVATANVGHIGTPAMPFSLSRLVAKQGAPGTLYTWFPLQPSRTFRPRRQAKRQSQRGYNGVSGNPEGAHQRVNTEGRNAMFRPWIRKTPAVFLKGTIDTGKVLALGQTAQEMYSPRRSVVAFSALASLPMNNPTKTPSTDRAEPCVMPQRTAFGKPVPRLRVLAKNSRNLW